MPKDSMVAIRKRQPFDFAPGSNWNYSNSGYFILGYIIEKVSGQSYSEYVLNKVIRKAGLKNTFVNRWDNLLVKRAKGYMKGPNGWQNAMYISMEGPYSAGAIISTATDLYKWNWLIFLAYCVLQPFASRRLKSGLFNNKVAEFILKLDCKCPQTSRFIRTCNCIAITLYLLPYIPTPKSF